VERISDAAPLYALIIVVGFLGMIAVGLMH
jgi:hypothetical protein